jgi:lipopolysaccharide export system permease protein
MRLLDRYLLRELLVMLGFCLGGLLIAYIAFDLISSLNHFQEQDLRARDVVDLYVAKLPAILVFVMPITLLIALLYVLTNHARHNELTAMRAAGLSLWRICLPYLTVGFLLSVAVFVMNELWVPDSQAKQEEIMNRHKHKADSGTLGFDNARDGRKWFFSAYDFRSNIMTNVKVDWREQGTNWSIRAERAERVDGVWTFGGNGNYPVDVLEADITTSFINTPWLQTNRLAMPQFTETPRQFANEVKFSRRLGTLTAETAEVPISELLDFLRVHRDISQKYRWWLHTQLQARFAQPWRCLVVVLIAIPFGAASGRRNIFMGVAGSIIICFVYFVLLQMGLALGTGGYLPAWVAAWLPNAVFGLAGFWLMLRVR